MTVLKYDWGNLTGGSSGGDTPVAPSDSSYGTPECFSGTALVGTTTITFTSATKSVHVYNRDDVESMDVSFDGGVSWITVAVGGDIREYISITSLQIRVAAGEVDYYIIAALTG